MRDNIKHIIAGFVVGAIVGLPAYLDSGNLFAGLWPALTGGCIAGGKYNMQVVENETTGNI